MLVGYRQWLLIIHLMHFRMLWSLQKQSCSSKAPVIYVLDIYDILFSWVVLVALLNTDFLGVLLLQLHSGKEEQTSTFCTLVRFPGLPCLTFQNRNAKMVLWLMFETCLYYFGARRSWEVAVLKPGSLTLQSAATATRQSSISCGLIQNVGFV